MRIEGLRIPLSFGELVLASLLVTGSLVYFIRAYYGAPVLSDHRFLEEPFSRGIRRLRVAQTLTLRIQLYLALDFQPGHEIN
jgi:hypothetical protein